jgi:hypothetical protein
MRRVADSRRDRPGLLVRRPHLDRRGIASPGRHVNPVDQYRALISLFDRGLLSAEELQAQGTLIAGR